jgi:hypothetical protein
MKMYARNSERRDVVKRSVVLLITVLALVLAFAAPTSAVTNGTPDGDNHPYVGLLVFDVYVPDVGNAPAWRCSGSLISPKVVLTAGHCTDGAVAARVWFDERLQDDDGTFLVPDYPFGGGPSIEGTPFTSPDFAIGAGNGLPGFAFRDVGIVVLDEAVTMAEYAFLPEAGLADTLRNKTDMDYVGYGVQEMFHEPGGGAPFWIGLRNRMFAPGEFVSGNFRHSAEFVKLSANPGRGTGGTCFGDSGGPTLLADTATVVAVNSYVTNGNCAGVTYSSRVDIPEVLDWIYSFM